MLLTKNFLFVAVLITLHSKQCKTEEVVQIIHKTIQEMVKNSYCVIYYTPKNKVPLIVQEALKLDNMHTFYSVTHQISDLKCGVFIIFSDSLEELHSAFARHLQESNQLLNKKILVFFSGNTVLENKGFMEIYPKSARVVFVEGVGEDMTNIWNTTTRTDHPIKVTFTSTGKEVIPKSIRDLDFKKFYTKSWRPQIDKKFRISLFRWSPYVIYHESTKTFTGAEYDIVREIIKDWPVEHKFHGYNDTKMGGYWNEVVDEVDDGKSDIALGSLWQSVFSSHNNVFCSYPYTQVCITFLVPKPKLLSDASYVFQPLSLKLWILIIVVMFITCLCVRILTLLEQKGNIMRQRQRIKHSNTLTLIFYGIRIFTLGSIKRIIPAALIHLRILFLAFAFTSLCLSTAYSGGFTSSLTSPRYEDPIWTIKDMIKQNIKLSADTYNHKAHTETFLGKSANPDVRSFANKIASNNSDKYSGARVVQDLNRKYITGSEYLDDYSKTHYQVLRECIKQEHLVLALQRNSPFLSFFNKQIQRFIEHGFVDHWHNIALSGPNMSYMSNFYTVYVEHYHPKPLNIQKLQGAFHLLNAGLLLGSLIFLIELIYWPSRNAFNV